MVSNLSQDKDSIKRHLLRRDQTVLKYFKKYPRYTFRDKKSGWTLGHVSPMKKYCWIHMSQSSIHIFVKIIILITRIQQYSFIGNPTQKAKKHSPVRELRPAGWMMFHYTTRDSVWDVYESKTVTWSSTIHDFLPLSCLLNVSSCW